VPSERPPETAQAYAQAIFEEAAGDWLTPLRKVADALTPADFETLDNPAVPFSQKQELLQRVELPDTPERVKNFLSLLASKNRIHMLPEIIDEFDRYAQRGPLPNTAKITSAIPLTDEEKRRLQEQLCRRFGQDTLFEYTVNPSILGGVIVRIGDKVIDGSVSGKLAALRDRLK
jgi:F-type H+-transporting ATPase subunit delta